jgi:hypothetical protein
MRLDKVTVPPGLIASAKTYTLILENEGLYVIHTGPAAQAVRTRGIVQAAAVQHLRNAYDKKIAAGEAKIESTPLEELVKHKHNRFIKKSEILSLKLSDGMPPVLKLKSSKGNYRFHFNGQSRDTVEDFAAKLGQ